MNDGFLKVCAATPTIEVADCIKNSAEICKMIEEASAKKASLLVLPELCITGYTCGDLFLQKTLVKAATKQLLMIRDFTAGKKLLVVVGFPFEYNATLYNAAAVLYEGKILGIVPKSNIRNHAEFSEGRYFVQGHKQVVDINIGGEIVPFGTDILFKCRGIEDFALAVEICADVWGPVQPGVRHALAGATVIANLSASNELVGKDEYRTNLIKVESARLVCGYVYADAGEGESTTDVVFAGHNMIAEIGTIIAESERFKNSLVVTDIDLDSIVSERRRQGVFVSEDFEHRIVEFDMQDEEKDFDRSFPMSPFIPTDKEKLAARCEDILMLQAMGLKKRLSHIGCKTAVLGISGGLDSTLALLVTAKTFDMLGLPRENIIAVTMPCFGTSDRTFNNAVVMTNRLGATLREVRINKSVEQHFEDIGHDINKHDLTYENAQARERTQVLMDIAGDVGGIVVGTGDLSELVLGWATYNGDHMSMYGVNAGIPKTLLKHIVRYFADTCKDEKLAAVLYDVLDTPVSPELLPPKDGEINQKTEDIVGPYELHDFFIYHVLKLGYNPKKLYRVAKAAFAGIYDSATVLKWLNTFYRRFFTQQFKRSCLPDGPKVGSVGVSPRGDLKMPSDASMNLWLRELETLKP